MRPFPIYPLYTRTVILSLDKPIADCFLFRPRKSRRSAGNAVIPAFPIHRSHGLQHLRHKRPTLAFTGESGHTHSPSPTGSHTAAHTPKQGPSGRGRYHYPRHVLHVHEHPRAGCQNGVLCRFGILAGGSPEERRKPSGQRCAYARRCPEASRPRWAARLFYFCLNCGVYALRSGPFRVCETRGGITTLGVLCVLLKRWTAACQKGSFAVF